MKKLILFLAVGLVVAVVAAPNGYFKQNSDGTIDVVATEAEVTTVTATTVSATTVNASGNVDYEGLLLNSAGGMNVTNGAEIVINDTVVILNGIGGANDTTNTIVIGDAPVAGQMIVFIVNSASTNLIQIADAADAVLAGAWIGDAGDSITLMGTSSTWVELSRSDN